jgi:hypothetical protein
VKGETVELCAPNCRPEHAAHEVVLAPHAAGGRREDGLERIGVTKSHLLSGRFARCQRQIDQSLPPCFCGDDRAGSRAPLNSRSSVCEVKVGAS